MQIQRTNERTNWPWLQEVWWGIERQTLATDITVIMKYYNLCNFTVYATTAHEDTQIYNNNCFLTISQVEIDNHSNISIYCVQQNFNMNTSTSIVNQVQ